MPEKRRRGAIARQQYTKEIEVLVQDLLRMGKHVEEAFLKATQSLKGQDVELARQILHEDDSIDAMEKDLEERCVKLIALQAPLAGDLRTIHTILKVVTDLERIGDQAINIAELTLRLSGEPLIKPLVDIPKMAEMAGSMLHRALKSFVDGDTGLAREVCLADDAVDELYSRLYDELIELSLGAGDRARATQAINLLFAARFLERIADHATNIAERVIYMVEGRRVPHQLKGYRDE